MRNEHDAHRELAAGIQGSGDRRESRHGLIAYYEHQARLADRGDSTRRSAEFCRRQILYFQQER